MEQKLEKQAAQLLKQIRKKSKIKTSDVAEKIGISVDALYQYESEDSKTERRITLDMFWRWCIALDKKPQVVLGTLYERKYPRSHTSKATRLKRLMAKPIHELSREEREFVFKHSQEAAK